jgi:hypothetical protein
MPSATCSISLEKYRAGQSGPILVAGENVLKPALRLMTSYRLVIEEIKDNEVISSYTRWVGAVQVTGSQNQEVYLSFSLRFSHIGYNRRSVSWSMLLKSQPISDSDASRREAGWGAAGSEQPVHNKENDELDTARCIGEPAK